GQCGTAVSVPPRLVLRTANAAPVWRGGTHCFPCEQWQEMDTYFRQAILGKALRKVPLDVDAWLYPCEQSCRPAARSHEVGASAPGTRAAGQCGGHLLCRQ